MRTGVLGGTFDPPHLAHLVLAAAARSALSLDRVLFVPAGVPWRKAERAVSAAPVRVRMVQAAIADLPWAEVCTLEVEREGPSYAADTLRSLTAAGGEWWFILGADALTDMPHWHSPATIVAAARLALATRGSEPFTVPPALRAQVPAIEERIDRLPMPALDVSSTDLRGRIHDGRPTEVLLPQAVRAVVDELGLYRDS